MKADVTRKGWGRYEMKKEDHVGRRDKIGDALLKVALGCSVAEVTEEYAEVDGALKLTKRKRTKKDIPPDLKAVQILLASGEGEYGRMSDEELEAERQRLLAELRRQEDDSTENKKAKTDSCSEKKTSGTERKNRSEGESAVKRKPRAKPRKRVVRKIKTEEQE